MTTRADLIIVGAGLAGSAAAWAASARGLDVVVLEAFGPGHRNGSSHGSARIFRRAYPDPLYVRLTGTAGELWRRLEDQAGERLLTLTGGIDFGATRAPRRLHEVLTSCGVPAELLEPAAAAERWPYFDFDGVGPVMFHADAGVLDPHNAMAAMLRLAKANGADVRFGTPVTRLEAAPGGRRRGRAHRQRRLHGAGDRGRGRRVDRPAARRRGRTAAAAGDAAAGLSLRPGLRSGRRGPGGPVAGLHPR